MEGWIVVLGSVVVAIIRLMTVLVRFAQLRYTVATTLMSLPKSVTWVDVEFTQRRGLSLRVRGGPGVDVSEG